MTMIHEPALVGAPESPVRRGLADVWPVCVGLAPFALAIGAAISSQGMRPVDGLLGGAFVLGGSAQLAGIDLVGAGAGAATVVVTIALVNLRFALYSASFASWFRTEPLRRRLVMATVLIDQNHALCQAAFAAHTDPTWRRRYYATISLAMLAVFFTMQVVGIRIGAVVPTGLGLHLAGPLVFAGLLAGAWKSNHDLVAGVGAAVLVVAAAPLPNGLALPLGIVIGALGAAIVGGRR